ncbi:MAG: hypothetical protein H6843_16100 [Rhodospirillaceae bacterium]|nr:hypothetical protein [Rhodospirillaceae bacterium]
MTGTHAGAIDIEWLINNLVIQQIPLSREEDDLEPTLAPTFAFTEKARSAAEDFLLARYRLFATVYLHKATRGFEQIVAALVRWLGTHGNASRIGIESSHPLISFLLADGDGHVSDYARLDDFMLWGLIERISRCSETEPKLLAQCMLDRKRPKCLDISKHHGNSLSLVASTDSKIQEKFQRSLGATVFRDSAVISAYKQINGDPTKEHKRIRVRTSTSLEEITSFTESLINQEIQKERSVVRYYFLDPEDFEAARDTAERGH